MKQSYDLNSPKKATNLSINSDLLRIAKSMDINLSATLERGLAELVAKKRREHWQQENREAISAYNVEVEEKGVFSDGLRGF